MELEEAFNVKTDPKYAPIVAHIININANFTLT